MGTIICIALTIVILVVVIKSAKENKKQAELTKQRNDEKKTDILQRLDSLE